MGSAHMSRDLQRLPLEDIHTSGGAASSDAPAQMVAMASQGQETPEASPRYRAFWVDNCVLRPEHHGVPGHPGSYSRVKVVCPCPEHNVRGQKKCWKTRSFSERLAKASGLGDQEPYFFLTAWLKRRSEFADRASHASFEPSTEEVVACAAHVGLVQPLATEGGS